jgi:hypothetical protein
MRNDINGTGVRCSGDINLVASIMAQGVPLAQGSPVSIIEGGERSYSSYRLMASSPCGRVLTETLMDTWDGKTTLPPDHGFSVICRFIKARPKGLQRSEDMLAFAVDYLSENGHKLPGLRCINDIPGFVDALPNSEASFVLAYVFNRDICYKLHTNASRKFYKQEGNSDEARRAIIDTSLPRWKSRELLARLEG